MKTPKKDTVDYKYLEEKNVNSTHICIHSVTRNRRNYETFSRVVGTSETNGERFVTMMEGKK